MYNDFYDDGMSSCPPGTTAYIIQAGDTYFSLARRFGTTPAAIAAANPGVDPDRLQIGQRICIPELAMCPPGTTPYAVRAGDTFYSLARRFNTTVAAIVSANPYVDPNMLMIGQQLCIPGQPAFPPCPEGNYYTIRRGDSLYAIARRYNISLDDLIEANPGIDPARLRIGQVICIPLATPPVGCPPDSITYTIAAGDTFYALARRYNISVDALIAANPRVNPDALLIGQRICIPRA